MHRPLLRVAVLVTLVAVVPGCGDDGGAGTGPSTPASTTSSTSTPAISTPVVVTSPPDTAVAALPDVTAVAALGYPRDLLDRGRVNVVVARRGDEPFVVVDHQLVVDGFTPAPVEQRRIVIPADEQRVAIQAMFGDVVDCEAPTPLAAALAVHYTYGDDPTIRAGEIELDDTSTLADIRSRSCTARRVLADNDVALGVPMLDGETITLDLTIQRRRGDDELTVEAIQGTVLFGAASPFEQGAPERTLAPGAERLVLPLVFDVNRCDPHAVAETTRKKGLTLWIAVDGAPAQPVDVDITAIEDDLEEILNRCKERTGV